MRSGAVGQGSNSAQVRQFNERVILTLLRRLGAASKADLARHAQLTSNTAGQIVRELEEQRLVRSEGKRTGARGQPATLLRLDPEGAYSIGIKIGRRSLDALLVDFSGHVLERRRLERSFPLPDEAVAFVRESVMALRRCLNRGTEHRLAGLGVATPYNLGSWQRELDIPNSAYQRWNDVDVKAELEAATGLAVFVENDGTAAAVAELFQGHGRSLDDFLYVFIGTAAGGGVILGGDYHRGVNANAGDLGLMPTLPSRLPTAPRPRGPYEILLTRASLNALIRHLRGRGFPIESRRDLEPLLEQAHPAVGEWLEDAVDALVLPVLSAVRILDVPAVVIDGDLPRPLLLDLIARLEIQLGIASPESREPPRLLCGSIGREAPAIGAAILPLHLNFSPSRDVLIGY
ncbi:ROK family protein [Benzoatithermus flavus]|uniref:ROK family transcriptional regulator n=1 Tax=Benzoatithermus flavus TaxID=3108223 RepID=A0ABU8XNH4_9PROT